MKRQLNGFSRRLFYSGAALATLVELCAPHAALAQTSGAGGQQAGAAPSSGVETLGEIIVTATRHTQTLQKTPASVTVLTADALKESGVYNMEDLGKLVPNLSFDTGFRAGVPQIDARGIPTSQGGEAPVAFIVDGAQAPSLEFINQDLLNLESVQVLLGPQGALYGRGAIGGAVIVTTKPPTDTFHDSFDAVYGNGNLGRIINTASGAIVPGQLWASATLEGETFGGLIRDIGTGKPADWSREQSGRLYLLYKPTDSTTASLTWSHTQGVDGASSLGIVPNSGMYDFTAYQPDRNLDTSDTRIIDSVVGRIDHATSFGTFTSISQGAQSKSSLLGDADWSPAPVAVQFNSIRVQAFNEDVRFTSPTGTPFQWLIGAFFQYRDTVNYLDVFGEAGGPFPGATLESSDEDSKSVAYAGYGQASYDFSGGVKITAALRYDTDDRYDADNFVAGSAIRHQFSAFQPSGTISKQWSNDILTYATVGEGFRSGGFNGYQDTAVFSSFPGVVSREYPSENVVNYEAGAKTQWFDRKLTVNADFYYADYTDEQYYLSNISPPARDIATLKSVSINGGELNVVYSPFRSLTFGGDIGAAYSRINSNDAGLNDQGKFSPDAPLYTANLNGQYEWSAFADYKYVVRAEYEYKGPIYYDPANDYSFHPTGFVNLRAALQNGAYSFALWGKNVTGTRYPIFIDPNFEPGFFARQLNEPATFGVEFRYTR